MSCIDIAGHCVLVVIRHVVRVWAEQEGFRSKKGRRNGLLVWVVWVFGQAGDLDSDLEESHDVSMLFGFVDTVLFVMMRDRWWDGRQKSCCPSSPSALSAKADHEKAMGKGRADARATTHEPRRTSHDARATDEAYGRQD